MGPFKLAIIFLLSATSASASVHAQIGMGRKVLAKEPFERFASVGYKTNGDFQFKGEAGFYLDYENETKMTGFASASVGYELKTKNGTYVSAFLGPAVITQKDRKLGSYPQCAIDFGIGVKLDSGKSLGLHFKHFSNGGIWQPNIGRDLLAVQVQF